MHQKILLQKKRKTNVQNSAFVSFTKHLRFGNKALITEFGIMEYNVGLSLSHMQILSCHKLAVNRLCQNVESALEK